MCQGRPNAPGFAVAPGVAGAACPGERRVITVGDNADINRYQVQATMVPASWSAKVWRRGFHKGHR